MDLWKRERIWTYTCIRWDARQLSVKAVRKVARHLFEGYELECVLATINRLRR